MHTETIAIDGPLTIPDPEIPDSFHVHEAYQMGVDLGSRVECDGKEYRVISMVEKPGMFTRINCVP